MSFLIYVAVSDKEILTTQRGMAQKEGDFACPEGATTLVALVKLKEKILVGPEERSEAKLCPL